MGLENIESLILNAEKNESFKTELNEVGKRFFPDRNDFEEYFFKTMKVYKSLIDIYSKIPTNNEIRKEAEVRINFLAYDRDNPLDGIMPDQVEMEILDRKIAKYQKFLDENPYKGGGRKPAVIKQHPLILLKLLFSTMGKIPKRPVHTNSERKLFGGDFLDFCVAMHPLFKELGIDLGASSEAIGKQLELHFKNAAHLEKLLLKA